MTLTRRFLITLVDIPRGLQLVSDVPQRSKRLPKLCPMRPERSKWLLGFAASAVEVNCRVCLGAVLEVAARYKIPSSRPWRGNLSPAASVCILYICINLCHSQDRAKKKTSI